jgi:predicted TIM-barrel fold metal-dependent hydrolase
MPDGSWFVPRYSGSNTIDNLLKEMVEYNIRWAFTIGMRQGGWGYDVDTFSKFVKSRSKYLYPIAFFDFLTIKTRSDIEPYLKALKNKDYVGIKIHPRFAGVTLENRYLPHIIKTACRLNLVVMICTYFYANSEDCHKNSMPTLIQLLSRLEGEKVILLHSGTVHLLEMMEVARAFANVLLDLSFTISEYEGSSLDLDIKFMFQKFDRRICVGSDSPSISLKRLRERFEFFAEGIDREKLENIGYRNILNFTGVESEIIR